MKLRYFLPFLLLVAACDGSAILDNPEVGPIDIIDPVSVIDQEEKTQAENIDIKEEIIPVSNEGVAGSPEVGDSCGNPDQNCTINSFGTCICPVDENSDNDACVDDSECESGETCFYGNCAPIPDHISDCEENEIHKGSYIVETQEDWNKLQSYCSIQGDLKVKNTMLTTMFNNTLRHINGTLRVENNEQLGNIWFVNLKTVGFTIVNNNKGLYALIMQSLKKVNGPLMIKNNVNLKLEDKSIPTTVADNERVEQLQAHLKGLEYIVFFGEVDYLWGGVIITGNEPTTCEYQMHCADNEACVDGICQVGKCVSNLQCGSGEICLDNVCQAGGQIDDSCESHSDCTTGSICDQGNCIEQIFCMNNSDCDVGMLCDENGDFCRTPQAGETPKDAKWDTSTAIKSNSDKRMFLFARDNNKQLVQMVRGLDAQWSGENIYPLPLTDLQQDPVALYNPTTGKIELFVIEGEQLLHFVGKDGVWENAYAPTFITQVFNVKNAPVAVFHPGGDISLFVLAYGEITQYRWAYDHATQKTGITSTPISKSFGNEELDNDSKLAAVVDPDGRIVVFARTIEGHLMSYTSPDGKSWGTKPAGFGLAANVDGNPKRIGTAHITGSPVAAVSQSKVYVYARGDDDNTAEYHPNSMMGLYAWTWDQSAHWGTDGQQHLISTHDFPHNESLSAVYDVATDKVLVFGANAIASSNDVRQYEDDNVYFSSTVAVGTVTNDRLCAIFNPMTQETEVFGTSALDKTIVQFFSAQGTASTLGDTAIGGNPVVIYNDWID